MRTLGILLLSLSSAHAAQLTNNNVNDLWSPTHATQVGDRLLWTEDDQAIVYYDGQTAAPIQDVVAGVPELDFVANFVFGLGTGSSPGEVVGAWRRGADYAWVWTSGGVPVQIDAHGTNPFVPGGATNPENVAIADGCVFLITQAQDPNDGSGNVYKNVFEVDPSDGSVAPVSGNLRAFGADRVVTDGCNAAWVYDPNDDILVSGEAFELQIWDGTQTLTLDRGAIDKFDLDLADGKLVYVKQVEGREQLFLIELDSAAPTPRQLTDTMGGKASPRTDGRHVAWGEEVRSPAGATLADLRLLGGLRVAPRVARRPVAGPYAILLDGGQLAWRIQGNDADAPLYYLADNAVQLLDPDNHGTFISPQLSGGRLSWRGVISGAGADQEISLFDGLPAQDLSLAPPPLLVQAELGPTALTVRWDEVLGVDGSTLYLAEEPGITPQNYQSLAGGVRFDDVASPFVVNGIDPTKTYHAVVTSTEAGSEGPPSGEAVTFGYLVDTTADTIDAVPSDGICADSQGNCSLRAALSEAAREEERVATIALPAGSYTLSLSGVDDTGLAGDLDVRGALSLLGAGTDQTAVVGTSSGQFEGTFDIDPDGIGFTARLVDLAITGARQGITNDGELVLERVRIHDNGGENASPAGAGMAHDGETLEVIDSELDGNVTTSHAGALFIRGTTTDLRNTELHDNRAGIGGGAIYMFTRDVRITDSVLEANSARFSQGWPGGAIYQEGGTLEIRSSTLAANDANACGGAIYTGGGEISLTNTTVSGNNSDVGGGAICSRGGDGLTLVQSTLAFNTAPVAPTLDLGSGQNLQLHSSVFHNTAGLSDCVWNTLIAVGYHGHSIGDIGNCAGGNYTNVDPLLEPLADNGGPTPTHALMPTSPARDVVPDGACTNGFDQRGEVRPVDSDGDGQAHCDAGAFEAAAACVDADGDGFPSSDCLAGIPADCDDLNADSWATPGENLDLLFTSDALFVWSAPLEPGGTPSTLVHQILRSEEPFDLSTTALCGTSDPGLPEGFDPSSPAPGGLFVYLTRATNGCTGASSWGSDSEGLERVASCP